MAKATATCTCRKCGNTFYRYTTKASRREADSWVEWAERTITICPDCENAEREERASELSAQAAEAGMPELEGSAKQIAWAEDIREKFISETGRAIEIYKKHESAKHKAGVIEATRAYILKNMSSAHWWIEHRIYFEGTLKEVYANNKAEIDSEIEK